MIRFLFCSIFFLCQGLIPSFLPFSTISLSASDLDTGKPFISILKLYNTELTVNATRLIEAVDDNLNVTYSATGLDTSHSFYSIDGMSGKKYRFFINTLVKTLGDTSYLEVGTLAGSTLCSAIYDNKVHAVAIDNWSQFGGPRDLFFKNLEYFMTPEASVYVIEDDFRAVDYKNIGLFDIYLFDGPHEEKDQYDGLNLAMDALNNEFVFIVDDWNWAEVRQGTMNAIRDNGLKVLYAVEIRTTLDNSHPQHAGKQSDWHNGYYISILSKEATAESLEAL